MSNNQVFHTRFEGLVRVIAKRENSIRYTAEAGSTGKAVLNFTVVKYHSGSDDEDPVFIDVALWDKMAEKFNGVIEDGQIARLDVNDLQLYLDSYENREGEEIWQMKGKTSVGNGYQFTLFAETVSANTVAYQQQSQEDEDVPAKKSITGKKGSKKNDLDMPDF